LPSKPSGHDECVGFISAWSTVIQVPTELLANFHTSPPPVCDVLTITAFRSSRRWTASVTAADDDATIRIWLHLSTKYRRPAAQLISTRWSATTRLPDSFGSDLRPRNTSTNWLLQTDHVTVSAPTIRFFLTTYGASPNLCNNNNNNEQPNDRVPQFHEPPVVSIAPAAVK